MRKSFTKVIALLVVFIMAFSVVGVSANNDHAPVPVGETAQIAFLSAGLPFIDIFPNDNYYSAIVWAYENEIMFGIRENLFAPLQPMTRAMLVTVLWRYAGMPYAGVPTFDDVRAGAWYSPAVAWAAENGIVTGYSATQFAPADFVNREQMYTILYRYMHFAGLIIELINGVSLQQFTDEDEISPWALDAMYFMLDAQVLVNWHTYQAGTSLYAAPRRDASRGEIAMAMYLFDIYSKPMTILQ